MSTLGHNASKSKSLLLDQVLATLRPDQQQLLRALVDHGAATPLSYQDLQALAGGTLDEAAFNSALDGLDADGLIRRKPGPNGGGRAASLYQLTFEPMPAGLPGRVPQAADVSIQTQRCLGVWCQYCCHNVQRAVPAGVTKRQLAAALRAAGWRVVGGLSFCPRCIANGRYRRVRGDRP
jgi:hypothetical protein